MKYIYIFEDGRVAVADTEPTETDLLMIADGTLQVVRVGLVSVAKVKQLTVEGVEEDGSGYRLNPAVIDRHCGSSFHILSDN